jgi:type I restriction enzyme S subunit
MSMSAVPLPPVSEQTKIVQIVGDCLRNISQTALSVEVQETSASRLRQSILKAAFEGRLVPQDPNDEPASALLKRITAKSSAATATKTKITTRRKAAAK